VLLLAAGTAGAQGFDSTPAERHLRILAELLPGHYSSANQAYFDGRRNLPAAERHQPREVYIRRKVSAGVGTAFSWEENGRLTPLVLSTDPADPVGVRAELGGDRPAVFRLLRTAGGYAGAAPDGRRLLIAPRELWIDSGNGDPDWLTRSRDFHCYADIPGVGGGRNIPFDRYDGITIHDQGGEHWFTSRDAERRQLGISLLAVNWQVLNEPGEVFNRNSLVLYVKERLADGTVKEHGYAFTEPDADRIGINLKWMLVNCAMIERRLARPEL
jgi:hypothetical protein